MSKSGSESGTSDPKTIEEWVLKYFRDNLKPVPMRRIHEGGMIYESFPIDWKKYCNRAPTKQEIKKWLAQGLFKDGIALVCGRVRENRYFYVIEFENREMYESFFSGDVGDVGDLSSPTVVIKTDRDSIQVYYLTDTPMKSDRFTIKGVSMKVHGDADYVIAPISVSKEKIGID